MTQNCHCSRIIALNGVTVTVGACIFFTRTTTHCGGQCFSEYTEVADLRTYKAIGCKPPPANGDYYTLAETPNGCQTDRNGYRYQNTCPFYQQTLSYSFGFHSNVASDTPWLEVHQISAKSVLTLPRKGASDADNVLCFEMSWLCSRILQTQPMHP